jgi:hypothetical protein
VTPELAGVEGKPGWQQPHLRRDRIDALRNHVSIRQHTSAYVSIRQHTSAYVSIRLLHVRGYQINARRNDVLPLSLLALLIYKSTNTDAECI